MFKFIWSTITNMFNRDNDHHVGDISKCPFMNSSAIPKDSNDTQPSIKSDDENQV